MLLRYFGCRSFSLFLADQFAIPVVNSSSSCVFRRYHGHHRRTSSRFKWPHQGFMPSRTPYQMFPAISTPDEANGLVNYLTKNERLLLLTALQEFKEEKDFDGSYHGLLGETAS